MGYARYLVLFAMLTLCANRVVAGNWNMSGSVTGEVRFFPKKPVFQDQKEVMTSPSLALSPEFVYEWHKNIDRLTLTPFLRWDANDKNRTHADLREASWLHTDDGWDVVAGISKVFWGVTESRHLVDIINQTDTVEDIDGEDKLGQPMVNLNFIRPWGSLRFFILPGFRERSFPADDARLRGALPIDTHSPVYESGAGKQHVDAAIRWTHSVAGWDLGLAHFYGTSREPRFLARTNASGQMVLVPHYGLINQTSLDAQLTTGSTLWKLEAITRGGQGDRFFAAVGGLEYTFYQVFASAADLGVLAEYLYDGRDNATAPSTTADDDIFLGARLTLNDVQDSQFLGGVMVDRHSHAAFFSIEAERRIGSHWKVKMAARFFSNIPDNDLLAGIRNDGFITLQLGRFF